MFRMWFLERPLARFPEWVPMLTPARFYQRGRVMTLGLVLALGVVMLSACAAVPVDSAQAPAAAPANPVSASAAAPATASRKPAAEFPPEILFQLLVAEVAASRGQLNVAIANYLAAARNSGDAGISRRATHLAIFAQDRNAALQASKLWSAQQPGNSEPLQVVAPLLLASGDTEASLEIYEELLAINADDAERTFKLIGNQLARERNGDAAMLVMERLLTTRNLNPHAQLAMAQTAARHARLPQALAAADQALVLQPHWADAVAMRAQVLNQMGDKPAAIAMLREEYQGELATDTGIGMTLAKLLAEAGDMAGARDTFETLARQQPDNADVHYAAGVLALQFNDLPQAEAHLLRVLELGNRRQEASYHLGLVYEQQGQLDQAIEQFSGVLIADYYLEAQLHIANLLSRQGEVNAAIEHLHEVRTNNDGERVRVYLLEGDLLARNDRQQEALDFYTARLTELPDNSSLLYARALVAEKLNDLAMLERDLLNIIGREPDNAQALNALGYTLADRTDRLPEALDYITRALALEPDEAVILDSMGWVQYRLGNHTKAVEILQRAFSLFDDPEIAAHLGEVLWVSGEQQAAIKIWNASLQKYPKHTAVPKVMQRFGL